MDGSENDVVARYDRETTSLWGRSPVRALSFGDTGATTAEIVASYPGSGSSRAQSSRGGARRSEDARMMSTRTVRLERCVSDLLRSMPSDKRTTQLSAGVQLS